MVFHCARLSCPLLVRRDDRVRPGLSVQDGTLVADADVVEDGLTEDVPSSMVGY